MGSLILKGGWVMVPIIVGSVIALTLVLERAWYFWSIRVDLLRFAERIFQMVRQRETEDALLLCARTEHPLAAVFRAGLEHLDKDAAQIERVMEREGSRQVQRMERNLNFLMVIVGVEPLLGFLGTILVLIQAFMAWERLSASVTVSALAAGIYQAMITTAAGLIVAIPYYVIYNVLLGKVHAVSQDVNHFGDEFLGVIQETRVLS